MDASKECPQGDTLTTLLGKCMMDGCACQKATVIVDLKDNGASLCVCGHHECYHVQIHCVKSTKTQKISLLQGIESKSSSLQTPQKNNSFGGTAAGGHRSGGQGFATASKEERVKAFQPYATALPHNQHSKKSSSKARKADGDDISEQQSYERDVMILSAELLPPRMLKVTDQQHLANIGRMFYGVKFSKGDDPKKTLDSLTDVLRYHDYRFVNSEKGKLVPTVYNNTKFPSHATLQHMYKSTPTKTKSILLQSSTFLCLKCSQLSSKALGGNVDDVVRVCIYYVCTRHGINSSNCNCIFLYLDCYLL